MSTSTVIATYRTALAHGYDRVTARHETAVGTTSVLLVAEAIVPYGRRVLARVLNASTYADPYVQVTIVDEADRELARTRAYVGAPGSEARSARQQAIDSAAKALAILADDGDDVEVIVGDNRFVVGVAQIQ